MSITLATGLSSLAGGGLIGLAAGGLRLLTGRIAGISGIARLAIQGPERGWRLAFLAGLMLPALFTTQAERLVLTAGLGDTPYTLLVLAGLLVGLGTGLGNGCTSGHGICGLARFSPRSLVAVMVFMGVAALVVLVLRHLLKGVL